MLLIVRHTELDPQNYTQIMWTSVLSMEQLVVIILINQ